MTIKTATTTSRTDGQRTPPVRAFDLAVPQAAPDDLRQKRLAKSRSSNLIHFDELGAGDHFADLEQPGLAVDQVRTCFAGLRL